MSVVLTYAGKCPVVKVGRMQAVCQTEICRLRSDRWCELPSYRGDIQWYWILMKKLGFLIQSVWLQVYNQSASTMNFTSSVCSRRFPDLHQVHQLENLTLNTSPAGQVFSYCCWQRIDCMLCSYMEACGYCPVGPT